MPGGRALSITFVGLVLVGLGLVSWLLLRPNPAALQQRLWRDVLAQRGRDAVTAELVQRTHQPPLTEGGRVCLRYQAGIGWTEAREKRLAYQLLREGLSKRLGARLPRLVRQWRQTHELRHHAANRAQERVALLLRHVRGLDRVVLELNRRRVVRSLERRWQRAYLASRGRRGHLGVAAKAPSALGRAPRPTDIVRLRRLWDRYRLLMASAYQISLEIPARDTTTGERMDRLIDQLKRWTTSHGRPPRGLGALPIDAEFEIDGFGVPFGYEVDPETVRLVSPGFDGVRGTADDQVRGFTWTE